MIDKRVHEALQFEQRERDFEFHEINGLLQAGWTKHDYEIVKGTEEKSFEE